MEENKIARKAAFLTGLAAFIGFILIVPMAIVVGPHPQALGVILIYIMYFFVSGEAAADLAISLFIGFISYFLFKTLLKKQVSAKTFKLARIVSFIIAVIAGFLISFPVRTLMMEVHSGKEVVGKIDTNKDGKPDKWVHHNVYDKLIEIDYDTNLDGNPDIWEYYKNRKVYKKEIDTDFDGKPDKIEKY